MKNKYDVTVSFTFKGTFTVSTTDKNSAKEQIEKHCGLVLGGKIHSTLPDEDIDWDFNVHPNKIIHNIKPKK